ncbi:MAG: hypothetical protein AAGC68_17750, partial [Verrucomicrobiota bacterium]
KLVSIISALGLFSFSTIEVWSQDVIFLKNGESAACRIETITDNILTFSLLTGGGSAGGSAKRTIPMESVAYVEFDWAPGEEITFQKRSEMNAELLESWWDYHFANLHRPRSRTAAFGIALGEALLRESPDRSAKRALELFDRIIARAWSEEDIAAAKRGRLNALIALDDLKTATEEASRLARETEDPALLIEVRHLLATADFERLKDLEEEHPRWIEDEEVKPERNRLYHEIIDGFLWPHLFHATREDAAARGLLSAAGVYQFAGETELAKAACDDLIALYPAVEAVEAAKTLLTELSNSSEPDKTP